jgi:Na+-translocating ferredoxin:NAD+ oxidoreductase subunit B
MILTAVAISGGVGLLFAVLIALANRRFRVWEDPRIDGVANMLPNANCGACGLPGCRAFAESAVAGTIEPAACTVAAAEVRAEIATYLGVDAGTAVKRVARLLCGGGSNVTTQQAEYLGHSSCVAAAVVAGGGKGCAWGCLGLADCVRSCDFDAIFMSVDGLPMIDIDKCTACGDCVDACPKDLLEIMPVEHRLLVQCRNLIVGDEILEDCKVGCTACGKCVQDAAPGLISIASGVAVIDYSKVALASAMATSRCPTDSIVWLEGIQFPGARVVANEAQGVLAL